MRITTWNVNGVRNPFGYAPWNTLRTFPGMFDLLQTDIIVMQELKIQRKDLRDDMVLLDGWDCYFSLPKQKKGYSGVGIYTRNATCGPIRAEEGILGVLTPPGSTVMYRELPEEAAIGGYPSEAQIAELGVDPALLDSEGRCVCLEFPAFVLFGVYSPANSNGLRDDFRYGFLCALDCRIRNLTRMGKRVVLVGDLNVSRAEIDQANAAEELKKEGISHEAFISTPNRRVFNQMVDGGEVVGERDEGREDPVLCDVVRDFHPERKGMYTHWEQKINARPGNFGSRIDFVLASQAMKGWFTNANIQEGLMGSDHCPVYGDFDGLVSVRLATGEAKDVHLLDIMSPPGYFVDGKRVKEWSVKDIPAFSGKLLPEFDKRRSIKDMFKRPALSKAVSSAASIESLDAVQKADIQMASATSSVTLDLSANGSQIPSKPAASPAKSQPSPARTSTAIGQKGKRKSTEAAESKTSKRQKSIDQQKKAEAAKSQQSLKGFFAPKQSASPAKKIDGLIGEKGNSTPPAENGQKTTPEDKGTAKDSAATQSIHNADVEPGLGANSSTCASLIPDPPPEPSSPGASSTASSTSFVHDPIVTKDAWAAVMKRPEAPLCEHGEPCKSMLTKKKGENQGRSFWMCQRPLGPNGQKERGSQWRCSTFIWCKDTGKT